MVKEKLTADAISKKLQEQHRALTRLMTSDDGRHALEFLAAKYGGDVVVKGDSHATHVRVGERNVVDYLIELSREREDG